jgi:hypothetical protein
MRDSAQAAADEQPAHGDERDPALRVQQPGGQIGHREAHGHRRQQDLQHAELGDERLPPEPALPDRGEVRPVGVATPAQPLLEEGAASVGEHGQRAGIGLVDGLVPGGKHQPGQSAVIARDAAPPQEELVFQVLHHRQHRRPPVGHRPARQAGHPAGPGLGANVVEVPDIDHPVGDPPPHAGLRKVGVLPGPHAADLGVAERGEHGGQQPALPACVRVGQHQDLAPRLADSDPERGTLAAVRERHHPQPSVHGGECVEPADDLGVREVGHHDHLARVFREPRDEALLDDVRILPEGGDDHRGRGGVAVRHRAVQPRQGETHQPDRPGDGTDEPDRHDVMCLPPPRADLGQGSGRHPRRLRAKPRHLVPSGLLVHERHAAP